MENRAFERLFNVDEKALYQCYIHDSLINVTDRAFFVFIPILVTGDLVERRKNGIIVVGLSESLNPGSRIRIILSLTEFP